MSKHPVTLPTLPPASAVFNYGGMNSNEVAALRAQVDRIRKLKQNLTSAAIEIGRELIDIKARLQHGQFGPWVESECNFDIRTAQRFIALAKFASDDAKSDRLSHLPVTLAYELSAKSTPPEVAAEVLDRASKDESIDQREVETRLREARQRKAEAKPKEIEQKQREAVKQLAVTDPPRLTKKQQRQAGAVYAQLIAMKFASEGIAPEIIAAGQSRDQARFLRAAIKAVRGWLRRIADAMPEDDADTADAPPTPPEQPESSSAPKAEAATTAEHEVASPPTAPTCRADELAAQVQQAVIEGNIPGFLRHQGQEQASAAATTGDEEHADTRKAELA